VTFKANGSSLSGSPLTYQWQFELPSSGGPSTCLAGCSPYGAPISGAQVSNTWTTSGSFHVQRTSRVPLMVLTLLR
jgi:hypothetical protein